MAFGLARMRTVVGTVETGLLLGLVATMVVLAVAPILLRLAGVAAPLWTDAAVRILVLWLAMAGALAATRDGRHIRVDAILHYLPAVGRRPLLRMVDGLTAAVCAVLAWQTGRLVAMEYGAGTHAFAGVPAWVAELALPVGFGLMAVRFALNTLLGPPEPAEEPC